MLAGHTGQKSSEVQGGSHLCYIYTYTDGATYAALQVQRLFETEMPRDAAADRVKNRCVLTGRARSVHRFARVSRIMVRQLAHYGLLPGVAKANW